MALPNADSIVTVEDALLLPNSTTIEYYSAYINPGLAELLSKLNINKKLISGSGVFVRDEEGTRYIDMLCGYGALNFGHNPPAITDALRKALNDNPVNILQLNMSPVLAALGHNIAVLTPGALSRSFFCNSGAEAVEAALKLVRKATGRSKLIYVENSFHGKTYGALSVTGRKKYQKPFMPLLPDCTAVPMGDLDALERELKDKRTAGFIIEPIQGEGGIIVPPPGYLGAAKKLCEKYGTLFIADEIQTGFGRTGRNFAVEFDNVEPDCMVLAKSLGGGVMPIGACVTTEKVWNKAYGKDPLLHTSTFGGNTYACIAALKALELLIKEDLAARAAETGEYALNAFRKLEEKHDTIAAVRGRGLMIGIEFKTTKIPVLKGLQGEYYAALVAGKLFTDYHIITAYTLNNPHVIRIEPPLTILPEHIDSVVSALDEICSNESFLSLAKKAL